MARVWSLSPSQIQVTFQIRLLCLKFNFIIKLANLYLNLLAIVTFVSFKQA